MAGGSKDRLIGGEEDINPEYDVPSIYTPSPVARKLEGLIQKKDFSSKSWGPILAREPSLTWLFSAKANKDIQAIRDTTKANKPFHDNINEALRSLSVEQIQYLTRNKVYELPKPAYKDYTRFMNHSWIIAMLSSRIVEELESPDGQIVPNTRSESEVGKNSAKAFYTGILHDIGRLQFTDKSPYVSIIDEENLSHARAETNEMLSTSYLNSEVLLYIASHHRSQKSQYQGMVHNPHYSAEKRNSDEWVTNPIYLAERYHNEIFGQGFTPRNTKALNNEQTKKIYAAWSKLIHFRKNQGLVEEIRKGNPANPFRDPQ